MGSDRVELRRGRVRSPAGEASGALELCSGGRSGAPKGGVLRFRAGEAPALKPLMAFTLCADDGEHVCGHVTRVFPGEAFVMLIPSVVV